MAALASVTELISAVVTEALSVLSVVVVVVVVATSELVVLEGSVTLVVPVFDASSLRAAAASAAAAGGKKGFLCVPLVLEVPDLSESGWISLETTVVVSSAVTVVEVVVLGLMTVPGIPGRLAATESAPGWGIGESGLGPTTCSMGLPVLGCSTGFPEVVGFHVGLWIPVEGLFEGVDEKEKVTTGGAYETGPVTAAGVAIPVLSVFFADEPQRAEIESIRPNSLFF